MKNDATLVNCARAGIVDEDAIREARGLKAIRFLNDVYPKDAEGPKSVADIADLMMRTSAHRPSRRTATPRSAPRRSSWTWTRRASRPSS